MAESKICTKCGHDKALTEYYTTKRGKGYTSRCKSCTLEDNEQYRQKNYEKVAARKRLAAQRDYQKIREYHYKRQYGITIAEFDALFASQEGRCAICNTNEYSTRMLHAKLVVDHCHETGVIRGLLCKACNIALGEFKDDVALLQKAIEYLNANNSTNS